MEILSSRVLCRTDDIARLRRFYERALGLHVYREYGDPAAPASGVVYFLGGGFLEITASTEPSPPITLWLQVRDVAVEVARLASAGVALGQEPTRMPWGLIEASVHDPQGNELRLVEVPHDHPLRRRVE